MTNDVLRELETWLRREAVLYNGRAEQGYSEFLGGREHLAEEAKKLTEYADALAALPSINALLSAKTSRD